MKHTTAKLTALILVLMLCFSLFGAQLSAGASAEKPTVRIVVENKTYSVENGAPWEGRILDEEVELKAGMNLLTVIESLLDSKNLAYRASEWGYLQEINGLAENALGVYGGWSITLNDWFTNEGATAYTVENGGISDGDLIYVMYSCAWGGDLGSIWGDSTTTLSSISFKGATLDNDFDPAVTEYTLFADSSSIIVEPHAYNKNYQVRTYLNNYAPNDNGAEIKRTQPIEVKDDDVVFVGVGNCAWPTMNEAAEETVYKFNVVRVYSMGDVNRDGVVDVNDVTYVQMYAADLIEFDDEQFMHADFNMDNVVDISDATEIQMMIAVIDA